MKKNYYAVTTKCGHVGKGKYIKVTFPICAESGKIAAEIARWMPRVKHHHKYCILNVNKIDFEEYENLLEKNEKNAYLQCKNIQEQNILCPDIYENVFQLYEEKINDSEQRKNRVIYKQKKNKIIELDIKNYFKSLNYDLTFNF